MFDEVSFAEFVVQLRSGDPKAVGEIEQRHGRRLRQIAARHLRSIRLKRRADPKDIVQAVMCDLLRNPPQVDFPAPRSMTAYLVKAVVHQVRDLCRRQSAQRRTIRRIETAPVEDHAVASGERDPVQQALVRDLADFIHGHLNSREWEIHRLRHAGLTWKQIGIQLGCGSHAARKQLERALARVRRELGIDGCPLDADGETELSASELDGGT